jgi:hypothetical protein
VRPTRDDLHVLASATRRPRQLARIVTAAVVAGHDVDVQIERSGRHYILILRVVIGEQIICEVTLPIVWGDIDEITRFGLLRIFLQGQLQGHRRWRARMDRRLISLGVAPTPSPPITEG